MAQAETGTFEVPLFQRMGLDICNKDVLEIGCGNGFGAYLISKKTPRSYTGLDVMAAQIELAQRQFPQYQFQVQDATDLSSFPDSSRDIVIIFGVLHHSPAWRKVIEEVRRVLRSQGSFFVEEPRGMDLRLFDFFFRWGHPVSDSGLQRIEQYLISQGFNICSKQWIPLMTMHRADLP